ncbi:MAG: phosphoglycerate kinase [Pseudomonadota bacterium]
MQFPRMQDLNLAGKRILIRTDFNTPINDGKIINNKRIVAAIPTIKMAVEKGALIALVSHLGRPTTKKHNQEFSLQPAADHLKTLLDQNVRLEKEWIDGFTINKGEIVLCENVRFIDGENTNDHALSKKIAELCEIYVMDAFGSAHRMQSSTYGVAEYANTFCAGPLLCSELDALSKVFDNPKHPVVAITGGSKISTKLRLLESLLEKVDQLIVGGGIANTFLAAAGYNIGKSLFEKEMIKTAKNLLDTAKKNKSLIPIPTDVICAKEISKDAKTKCKSVASIDINDKILDIGDETAKTYKKIIQGAGTIIWNGPVGVFEHKPFEKGTAMISKAIASSSSYSLAGGGDTIAAIEKYNVENDISYISTGGGAFLAYLEGKELPAVSALKGKLA